MVDRETRDEHRKQLDNASGPSSSLKKRMDSVKEQSITKYIKTQTNHLFFFFSKFKTLLSLS